MEKTISFILVLIMLVAAFAVAAVPASAADGEWTVYAPPAQTKDDYEGTLKAVPGYEYTSDGFHIIPGDWTDDTAWAAMRTKEPVSLLDGIYLEVRVDAFSYEASDSWINLNLWDTANMAPGDSKYGQGFQTLIRPRFDDATGKYYVEDIQWFMRGFERVYPSAELQPAEKIYVADDGTLTLRLELLPTDNGYSIFVNGGPAPAEINEWFSQFFKTERDNEAYVGVVMSSSLKSGTAECTITKFGTSKETALVPMGDDTVAPQASTHQESAPIIDSSTVPEGQPCLIYTGDKANSDTRICGTSDGDTYYIEDDFCVRAVTTNNAMAVVTFSTDKEASYDIDDFPVMMVLTKNYCTCDDPENCYAIETMYAYVMAGDKIAPGKDCKTPEFDICWSPIVVEDGEKAGSYLYFTYDLSDERVIELSGRIRGMQLFFTEVAYTEAGRNGVSVAMVAFFRSIADVEPFVYNYLGVDGGASSGDETNAPTEEPTVETTEAITEEITEEQTEAKTEKQTEAKTEAKTEKQTEKASAAAEGGCGSMIGTGAFVVILSLAVGASAIFHKKRK